MFELNIAKKYLIPKRKQLSVSLISLLSIVVISLVVWLVLVFLSVTEGIEKNWLKKLTALNAPVRITPTHEYFSSYYYLIDSISSNSNYTLKSISEKAESERADPYSPDYDMEPPPSWPKPLYSTEGESVDLVKSALHSVENLKQGYPCLFTSDFEISGALMRLRLLRGDSHQSFLTQVSYLNVFGEANPQMRSHLLPPTLNSIEPLIQTLHIIQGQMEDHPDIEYSPASQLRDRIHRVFDHLQLEKILLYQARDSFLPKEATFSAKALFSQGMVTRCIITSEGDGKLFYKQTHWVFTDERGSEYSLQGIPILFEDGLSLQAKLDSSSIDKANSIENLQLEVEGTVQGSQVKARIPFKQLKIESATIRTHFDTLPLYEPYWVYFVGNKAYLPKSPQGENGVILPKQFLDSGVKIGDAGYFSYGTSSATSFQEQRLPIIIAGFYDPGVMAIGARYILTKPDLIHHINASGNFFSLDEHMNSGIGIWFEDLSKATDIKNRLNTQLQEAGIASYWKVSSFDEYDFAKDLMQQFQSDKYLFSLVGVIILIVACCNIISLLTLLVNDKKKEIGIMGAMGVSRGSIALIFAFCGVFLGVISCLIGAVAAQFTMSHIDGVASILSFFQGHDAFNSAFYGSSLPNELSKGALLFILIATPLISLAAGLVPALKACKLSPSQILRSQ